MTPISTPRRRRAAHRARRLAASALVTFGLLAAVPAALCAQQHTPPTADGFASRVTLDNEHVLALELSYAPGAAASLHRHEHPRVVYVVEGGVLEVIAEDGSAARLTLATGQTVWRPAETHAVRNVGETVVRVLEIEIRAAGGEMRRPR